MERKIALVTGGGSGVGRACAAALAEAGFTLVLTGRRMAPLEEVRAALAGEGHLAITADVGVEADVLALFDQIEAQFGRLDLLFNNAGVNAPAVEIDDLSLDDWNAIVAANLTGSFLCARAAFGLMKRQSPKGGRIINNGSISAHVPRPFSAPYTATKHAVTGLTRSLSLDGRPYNIACGQIDIGNTLTDMAEKMTKGVPQADGSIAVEPVMDVSNVAKSVLHMASLPLEANVQFMTVMASAMPYIGRG